jgi:ATP-dependent DNA helicase PIF1
MKRKLTTASDPAPFKKAKETSETTLTDSQAKVLHMAREGRSFFFSGAAGSGKSFILKIIAEDLRNTHGESMVYVTASTGIAASAIGGTTLHSFAGVGLATEPAKDLVEKIAGATQAHSKKARSRWCKAKTLIIDECSMVDSDFFAKLDAIGRGVRRGGENKPFGGMQVIMCGDFFQLPPVDKTGSGTKPLLFETATWSSLIGRNIVILKEIIRQKDPKLINLLTELRHGKLSPQSMDIIEERRVASVDFSKMPKDTVRLFPTRAEAETVNRLNLQNLDPTDERKYYAVDRGDKYQMERLKDQWAAPYELVVRKGATVMFIFNVNMDRGVVNGTTGKVIGFFGPEGHPVVEHAGGVDVATPMLWEVKCGKEVLASRLQVPLILAYAITTHKSQGMTLTNVEVNTDRIFEHGQTYVAFSRATSLEGLFINGKMPRRELLLPDPRVEQWWTQMLDQAK